MGTHAARPPSQESRSPTEVESCIPPPAKPRGNSWHKSYTRNSVAMGGSAYTPWRAWAAASRASSKLRWLIRASGFMARLDGWANLRRSCKRPPLCRRSGHPTPWHICGHLRVSALSITVAAAKHRLNCCEPVARTRATLLSASGFSAVQQRAVAGSVWGDRQCQLF